jgi:hypothetical protein
MRDVISGTRKRKEDLTFLLPLAYAPASSPLPTKIGHLYHPHREKKDLEREGR